MSTSALIDTLLAKVTQTKQLLAPSLALAKQEHVLDITPISQASFESLSHTSSVHELSRALIFIEQQLAQLNASLSNNKDSGNISLHRVNIIGDNLVKVWRAISIKNKQAKPIRRKSGNFHKNYEIDWRNPSAELAKLKQFEIRLQQQLTQLIDERASAHKTDYARERLQRCRDTITQLQNTIKK
ncbi:hypothetical protein K0504_07690 [Neiella marina]|uniref:Restart primosome assembly protein PriC n=1 Tax=Neiella holothuriorum TaxID=2870530 RepID=A0ABS7EF10_9GAMM|nr:hypothetical protein [Neiella holothuriorum]MBW8190915.1 hypothetical protein [Neiella holothuriorum]